MTSHRPSLGDEPSRGGADLQLERVVDRLQALDPDGSRFSQVLRDTFDQLLDGQRTGRYDESLLRKTERTHVGTLVEINLQRAFNFDDGAATHYRIGGIEVECKFSRTFGGWEIPPEAHGHLCLVIWADDAQSRWSAGVVRIREQYRLESWTRDRNPRFNSAGVEQITWLQRDEPLPENLLLHLPPDAREAVFSHRSGQARVVELFRRVQGRIVSRVAVLTVAQQQDAPKRVRDARKQLRVEGTVILGHQRDHRRIAEALGLAKPRKGEWIAVRLTESVDAAAPSAMIGGLRYRVAADHDPPMQAPLLDGRAEDADDEPN